MTHQWVAEIKIIFVDAPQSATPWGNSRALVTSRHYKAASHQNFATFKVLCEASL